MNDGFDYSKEKSPAILILESLRENFNTVSLIKNFLNFYCISIVFSYMEDQEDFQSDDIRMMKIGDSLQY